MERRKTTKRFWIASLRAVPITFAFLVTSALLTVIACESANSREHKDMSRPLDEITLELTSNGFIPAEVTHSAGSFGIAVENKSGVSEFTLQLKAETGTVLKEIPVQRGSAAWSVDLQPGRYTLTEVQHEQWVCVITVQ